MFDVALKVPLSLITTTINRLTKRAAVAAEENPDVPDFPLYTIEALGVAIWSEDKTFNVREFMKACGMRPGHIILVRFDYSNRSSPVSDSPLPFPNPFGQP